MSPGRSVLALNCGSSSLKFGAYLASGSRTDLMAEGEAEEIGSGGKFADHVSAFAYVLDFLKDRGADSFDGVGHRFVHGGPRLREHTKLDGAVLAQLEEAVHFAPLHMPTALAVLKAAEQRFPGLPQVVCLDTAFHKDMPEVSRTFALPQKVRRLGVERYGFHGLSLESIVAQLVPLPDRLVIAHLGNGASITAVRQGVSIDTSMGLTPTGGVMMGTRCGDLDPGALIFLLRDGYASANDLERLCDHESGLLGVSGMTSDVRALVANRAANHDADLALRMFAYQVRKTIAGMAAVLEGMDALVFTGGIGEHAEAVRNEISSGLKFLNGLDVKVLPSLEDLQIARNTAKLI